MLSWLSPPAKLPRKKIKIRKGKNAAFPDHGHRVTPPVSLPIEKAIYNEATNFETLSELLQLPAYTADSLRAKKEPRRLKLSIMS